MSYPTDAGTGPPPGPLRGLAALGSAIAITAIAVIPTPNHTCPQRRVVEPSLIPLPPDPPCRTSLRPVAQSAHGSGMRGGVRATEGLPSRGGDYSGWNTAIVFPSGSLNQAERPMPAEVTTWSTV